MAHTDDLVLEAKVRPAAVFSHDSPGVRASGADEFESATASGATAAERLSLCPGGLLEVPSSDTPAVSSL